MYTKYIAEKKNIHRNNRRKQATMHTAHIGKTDGGKKCERSAMRETRQRANDNWNVRYMRPSGCENEAFHIKPTERRKRGIPFKISQLRYFFLSYLFYSTKFEQFCIFFSNSDDFVESSETFFFFFAFQHFLCDLFKELLIILYRHRVFKFGIIYFILFHFHQHFELITAFDIFVPYVNQYHHTFDQELKPRKQQFR